MIAIATIALLALLNRARGDDRWMPSWLPGRALWYVAPLVGAVALLSHGWLVAAAWAVAFVVAWVGPHGFLYDPFGDYEPQDREVDDFTAWLLRISGGRKWLAFWLRNLAILPGLILVGLAAGNPLLATVAPVFAAAVVGIYGLAWRVAPQQSILVAEVATGALWGLIILAA